MAIAARSQQAPADRLAQLRSLSLDRDSPTPVASAPDTSRRRGLWAMSLAFIAGSAIATAACLALVNRTTVPAPAPVRTRVLAAQVTPDRPGAIVATGYVVARRQATVAVEMVGRITSLPVQEGQFVRRGAVLATLDASLARAESNAQDYDRQASLDAITAIEAQLENAVVVRQRAESLRARGFATEASLTAALAQERALRAQAAQARSTLRAQSARATRLHEQADKYVVHAPFDGVILERNAQVGEIISPGSAGGGFTRTGLCTIADLTSLQLEVDVAEAYVSHVHPGQHGTATFDAYPTLHVPVTVIAIIPTVNREKATVTVRLSLDRRDDRIMPNMATKVSI